MGGEIMSNKKQNHLSRKQTDLIVLLVDQGMTQKAAGEKVGVHEATIWRWKQTPEFLDALEKAARNRFRPLGAQALGVIESLMENAKDENTKLKAATEILERGFGKVSNKIEGNVTLTIEDVLAAMHKGESENGES